ncbi:MAG: hypothetical protein ACI8QC_002472 [Planctomycetota bacterium]|jgi:hypothetical protein
MLLGFVLGAACALVCRYTVRDIGFVDLAGPEYQLVQVLPGLDSAAAGALGAESVGNLRLGVRDSGRTPDDPLVKAMRRSGQESGWVLWREDLEPIVLEATEKQAALEEAFGSPALEQVSREALASFVLAVVVESGHPSLDQAAHGVLDEALKLFDGLSAQLPREVPWPLRRVRVQRSERAQERSLLWSLGLSMDLDEPALALVYGRGKLAGAVLQGVLIERDEVLAQLVLVGESCECETPREWVLEPRLPLAWSAAQRASAVSALSFDPESPLVRAEVARILTKPEGKLRTADTSLSGLLFGYRESELVGEGVLPAEPDPDPSPSHAPAWVEGDGGDWGFADEPQAAPTAPAAQGLNDAGNETLGLSLWFALGLLFCLALVLAIGILVVRGGRQ